MPAPSYFKLKPTFWTGRTGHLLRRESPAVRELAVYLMSNELAGPFGLYHVELDMIVLQTGRTLADVATNLALLRQLEYAFYDDVTGFVWVREMAREQLDAPLASTDRRTTYARRWYARAANNPFLGPWYDHYVEPLRLHDEPGAVERRSHPREHEALGREGDADAPYMGRSSVIASTGSSTGELFEEGTTPAPARESETDREAWMKATFAEFWALYPRRQYTKRAYEAWCHIKGLDRGLAAHIIERLTIQRPFFDFSDAGRYIPMATTWINGECWNDRREETNLFSKRTEKNLKAAQVYARES